ncbi:MAG: hypothetical protein ACRD0H_23575 [Actinomycetes bacterium]
MSVPSQCSLRLVLAAAALASILGGCGRTPLPLTGNASCGLGIALCATGCTDTRWDPNNCGACSVRCAPRNVCDEGRCVTSGSGASGGGTGTGGFGGTGGGGTGGTCSPPARSCGATCTNTATDPANCGSCGFKCAVNQMCSMSTCVQGCAAPLVSCDGKCVDIAADPAS